jgi:polar amino acid transport system substrate-binding protein
MFIAIVFGMTLFFATVSFTQRPARLVCDIWPPYQTLEEESVSGYSTELIRAIYQRMGIPIESIKAYPWKRALQILETNHAEALFSANHTTDRDVFARYPDEILFESPWLIWSKNPNGIKSLDDLVSKRIGVVQGYSYTPEFWDFIQTYCEIEAVTNDVINFKKLAIGRLDAVVAEHGNGLYLLKTLQLKGIVPSEDIVIKKDGLHIIFNRANVSESFVRDFSNELRAFKQTQEYKALRFKYFDTEALE